RHTRSKRDWSSDVCSSDLDRPAQRPVELGAAARFCPADDPAEQSVEQQPQPAVAAADAGPGGGDEPDPDPVEYRAGPAACLAGRSEERRVGKEGEGGRARM